MTDATVAVNGLKALEVTLNLAAQVAFDRNFVGVDRVDDRIELLWREVFGTRIGVNVRLFEDFLCVARPHSVNVGKGSFDAFVAGDVYSE